MALTPDQKLCQQIADVHYAVSCAENFRIAQYNMPVYLASRKLLLTTIREVYGLTAYMAGEVYEDMVSGDFIVHDSVTSRARHGVPAS